MSETPYRDLKIDEIEKLVADGYEVVDVREDWEWQKGHIPGARHAVLAGPEWWFIEPSNDRWCAIAYEEAGRPPTMAIRR